MGLRINTNVSSLFSQRAVATSSRALARSLERLASGKRINSARDDAAGLAIATGIEAQVRGLNQNILNINSSKGYLSVAEGGLATQAEIIQRMKELALQAANGTLGKSERTYLNLEYQTLKKEIDRIATQTNINGTYLLDGSNPTMKLQVGTRKGETLDWNIGSSTAADLLKEKRGSRIFGDPIPSYTYYGQNAALAIGDLNNDGILDRVSQGNFGVPLSIRLGNGDGSFGPPKDFNAGADSFGNRVQLKDLNGDRKQDLITFGGATVSFYKGNGDGTFSAPVTSAWTSGTNIQMEDYNRDGNSTLRRRPTDTHLTFISVKATEPSSSRNRFCSTGEFPPVSRLPRV